MSEIIAFFYNKDFFHQSAFYLIISGTLGTVVAYLAGHVAGEGMEEGSLNTALLLHEQAATLSLWVTIFTAVVYLVIYFLKYDRPLFRILSILLFAGVIGLISRTGYLGGELVYKHGAGVTLALPDFSSPD